MVILILGSACVYYNTFFHAKQKFEEAEKSQAQNLERMGQTPLSPVTPPGQRSPAIPSQGPQPREQTGSMVNMQEKNLYKDAIAKANQVLQYHPNSKWVDDALWLIGKSYYNMGDYLPADRRFKELVTNHPKSKFADESYYYMGLCEMFLGHNDQALSAFAALEDTYGKSPYLDDMLFAEGAMEMMSENYRQADEYFADYAAKFPGGDSSARATYNLGFCREKQNHFTGAYQAYAAVVKFNPDRLLYFEATLASATAALKSDSVELGMRILDRLAKDERYFSRSGEIRLRVAEGHYLQGDIDKAIETYQNVTTSNPKTNESAEAFYKLGLIYQNDKFDLAGAKDAFAKAQQETPNSQFKNLALARSAQIAKLESYQAELQRADSLKRAEELSSLGGDLQPSTAPDIQPAPAGIDSSGAVADSGQVEPAFDTLAVQPELIKEDSIPPPSISNSDSVIRSGVDSLSSAVIGDTTFRGNEQEEFSIPSIATPDDSLRAARLMTLLNADLSPDTLARAIPSMIDTVLPGRQDTSAQVMTPAAVAPAGTPSARGSTNEDSLRAAILKAGIETRYLLSELYAYELNRPDSAINEYLMIAKEHPESPYAPKSLLAAAQVELDRGDTTAAYTYLRRVISEYRESPHAARAAEIMNSPFDLTGNALGLYAAAESLVFFANSPDSALTLFRYIAGNYPDLAPKAAFAAAWILDQVKGVEDSSAFFAYASVAEKYPETVYAQAASQRLGTASGNDKRRTPPRQSQQPQDVQKPPSQEGAEADTAAQSLAGDLPLAPRTKRVEEFIYPEALLSRELKGKVIFKIRLDIAGIVKDYEIIGPSGEYAIDSAATESLIRTEFDISELDLAQLDGYFQYSISFKRPDINIFNDPYRDRYERGP